MLYDYVTTPTEDSPTDPELRKLYQSQATTTKGVPLKQTQKHDLTWSIKVANIVNQYFSQPYTETSVITYSDITCTDGGSPVPRPNHSLAHGMRQAYLAVDVVKLFYYMKARDVAKLSYTGSKLYQWIKTKMEEDPLFLQKVEFRAAFQRSGRKSEATRDNDEEKEKFRTYVKRDGDLFKLHAKQEEYEEGKRLFPNDEVDIYARALTYPSGVDRKHLSNILDTSHRLDLRRLPNCQVDKVKKEISHKLFGTETPNPTEQKIVEKLWEQSGKYPNN